jgi:excisionase family DNA binding protein
VTASTAPLPRDLLSEERLSIDQAAEALNVSRPTVDRWLGPGYRGVRLRSVRIGGRRFILRSDLNDFLHTLQEVES